MNLSGRYKQISIAILCAVAVSLFQNCTDSLNSSDSASNLLKASNGGQTYDGKVSYQHTNQDSTCPDGSSFDATIMYGDSVALLARWNCMDIPAAQAQQVEVLPASDLSYLMYNGLRFDRYPPVTDPDNNPVPAGNANANASGYTWMSGAWGTCSRTCGGGTQTRIVRCQSELGQNVADSFCSSSGSKPQTSRTCNTQECAPAFCTDVFLATLCDAYTYLFSRWPDEAGARYWQQDLTARGIPERCWLRQISFSTRDADCGRHLNKFGSYPRSPLCPANPQADAPRARATAECP